MVLIDVGPGSWRKTSVANLPAQALSAVLITHHHSDHIGDLGEAMTQSWIAGRTEPLAVYGPTGVKPLVEGFNLAYSPDVSYRVAHHGEQIMPGKAAPAVAREITAKAGECTPVFDRDGFKACAFLVEHKPIEPAFGYRLEYKGRIVVISGDTAKSDNLAKHAKGADLLIHDVLAKPVITMVAGNLEKQGRTRQAKAARDILSYHASPQEAAEIATAAGVDTLVLTHMVPPPVQPQIEQIFLQGAAAFKGKVVLGKDGLRFDLDPK
jgi:ribonuclease Z